MKNIALAILAVGFMYVSHFATPLYVPVSGILFILGFAAAIAVFIV